MKLIAREEEVKILENMYESDRPEFLALYGRRRVGKTYLIRSFFGAKKAIFFNVTGSKNGPMSEQISHFLSQVGKVFYGGLKPQSEENWDKVFALLTDTFEKTVSKKKKIILFFDELPWMATRNSRLLEALDYHWNQHWSNDSRIKLIICGSSASWIINKIINNKGGLHNRVTKRMRLEALNLSQTKRFLDKMGVKLNQRQVLTVFMMMGGIPYYLSQVEKGLSALQIIEKLAFSKDAFFLHEFDNLFSSLFEDSDFHIKVVRLLASSPYGLGERELLGKVGPHALGGTGHKKLEELVQTGFIKSFKPLFNKKRGTYYRLVDEYTSFYLKWIDPIKEALEQESMDPEKWRAIQTSPAWYGWLGLAFESVCYKHVSKIKKTLGLNAISSAETWRYVPKKGSPQEGAQIDLLFDRQDDCITLCEMKYSETPFVLSKDYVEDLQRKIRVFKEQTKIHKQLFIALVAAQGLKNNFYSEGLITQVVRLEDLFAD
jgi:uncharacterized protein